MGKIGWQATPILENCKTKIEKLYVSFFFEPSCVFIYIVSLFVCLVLCFFDSDFVCLQVSSVVVYLIGLFACELFCLFVSLFLCLLVCLFVSLFLCLLVCLFVSLCPC